MRATLTDLPADAGTRRRRSLWLALALGLSIVLVYWRIFSYPFIYDDWFFLRSILFKSVPDYLRGAFSPEGKILYRPLGALYFLGVYTLFHLQPVGFHLVGLTIHVANSLLLVLLAIEITGDDLLAWVVGFLYAVAVTIHLEPLLWMAGFYDLGGVFFYLLSILLFVRGRPVVSALLFGLGVLTKESVVSVPVVLFLYLLLLGDSLGTTAIERIKKAPSLLWAHILVLLLYGYAKMRGISPMSLSDDDGFKVSLNGHSIVQYLFDYGRWAVDALLPVKELLTEGVAAIYCLSILSVVGLLLVWQTLYRAKSRSTFLPTLAQLVFWVGWLLVSLGPVLILRHHSARYFFAYALPAFLVATLYVVSVLFDSRVLRNSMRTWVLASLVILNIGSSWWYFVQLDGEATDLPSVEGTLNLVQRGTAVRLVEEYLQEHYPALPAGTTIIFDGLDMKAIYYSAGPQVWYRDSTIRVGTVRDFVTGEAQELHFVPSESSGDQSVGGSYPTAKNPLDPMKTHLLTYVQGVIKEQPLSAIPR